MTFSTTNLIDIFIDAWSSSSIKAKAYNFEQIFQSNL